MWSVCVSQASHHLSMAVGLSVMREPLDDLTGRLRCISVGVCV